MRRAAPAGLGTVGLAVAVASAAGYALLVLCGRLLQPAEFAVFLAYWSLAFGLGGVVSPLEQEVARQSAVAEQQGRTVQRQAVRTGAVGAVLVLALGAPLLLPAVRARLLEGQDVLALLVVGAAAGYAVQFTVRGVLLGQRRYRAYGVLVVGEAGLRLLLASVLGVLGLAGVVPLAVATAAGCLAFPLALPLVRRRAGAPAPLAPDAVAAVARRTGALMAAALLTSVLVTGYPALVSALVLEIDGEQLGALFAALTVARVPLLAVTPLQALAVPAVVRLLAGGGAVRLRRDLLLAAGAAVGLAGLGGVVGALLGPQVVVLLYGEGYALGGGAVAGLVVSSVLLGALLLGAAVLVALGAHGSVPLAWGAAVLVTLVVLVAAPADAASRVVLALVAGPAVGLLVALARAVALAPVPSRAA